MSGKSGRVEDIRVRGSVTDGGVYIRRFLHCGAQVCSGGAHRGFRYVVRGLIVLWEGRWAR